MGKDFDDFDHDSGFGKKSTISAGAAFIIWLIVLIVIIWILRAIGIRWFSACIFGLLIAACVLCFIFPLRVVRGKYIFKSEDSLFGIIILITLILLIIYIIWKVFTDYDSSRRPSWWGSGDNGHMDKSGNPNGEWRNHPVGPAGPF